MLAPLPAFQIPIKEVVEEDLREVVVVVDGLVEIEVGVDHVLEVIGRHLVEGQAHETPEFAAKSRSGVLIGVFVALDHGSQQLQQPRLRAALTEPQLRKGVQVRPRVEAELAELMLQVVKQVRVGALAEDRLLVVRVGAAQRESRGNAPGQFHR